jgi:hypothetical protein
VIGQGREEKTEENKKKKLTDGEDENNSRYLFIHVLSLSFFNCPQLSDSKFCNCCLSEEYHSRDCSSGVDSSLGDPRRR